MANIYGVLLYHRIRRGAKEEIEVQNTSNCAVGKGGGRLKLHLWRVREREGEGGRWGQSEGEREREEGKERGKARRGSTYFTSSCNVRLRVQL